MRILSGVWLLWLSCSVCADLSADAFAQAALARTDHQVIYDGSYRRIAYPNGDVPAHIGVCTDVVSRSYRTLGVDLQQKVHEDMTSAFDAYPNHRVH